MRSRWTAESAEERLKNLLQKYKKKGGQKKKTKKIEKEKQKENAKSLTRYVWYDRGSAYG